MRSFLGGFGCAVLSFALAIASQHAVAQAPGQLPSDYVFYDVGTANHAAEPPETVHLGQPMAEMPCDCGNCATCTASWGAAGPVGGRRGQWFVGGEYLNVRANFSDATAFLARDFANFVDTFEQYQFDYQSSYRFYGGYRLCDCCGEVRFTFTRFQSDGTAQSPAANANNQYLGPLETIAVVNGDFLQGSASVDVKSYDLDFARTIPLGSDFCGSCDGCCDPCWCPAWDLQWFGGVRFADVSWDRVMRSRSSANALRRSAHTRMDFDGAGARIGLQGRRYIGRRGLASVYAKGELSVLLGDVNYTTTSTDAANPGVVPVRRASFTRIIPVTDIEVGGSLHLSRATVSAGYLFSAWHDLGMGDWYDYGIQLNYDDANILGFDGYFIRAEVAY